MITKLEWAKRGLSDRQLEDVAGILRDPDTSLDRTYIDRWVKELDLGPQWERAQEFLVR